MSSVSYHELAVETEYLVNFRALAAVGESGIHQSDLDAAELQAKREIDSTLCMIYDVTNWGTTTPAIIDTLANYLGSAIAWSMRFAADGLDPTGGPPQGLRALATELIDDLVEDRRVIVNSDGTVQPKKVKDGLSGLA